ncbi:hypothetical protein DAPPUDRAFT_233740 [Daphnia pulex]|uniref:Uncharacterized protein n=1 Tax=Daphnia pulex TaxID=6669 RepID=E9FVK9_DAPPU|nr:hypothetical protein DAPPUDRAFT_233740 [Daphnia pulex]|eukprot:EFX88575.1 hypothetical protein DAPPUDRAFT_233740 [Daphnia pulex]
MDSSLKSRGRHKLLQHYIRHRRKTEKENAKLAVPDETVTPKLVEDKTPKAELIISLKINQKASSHRKRKIELVSEVSEEKRPRVEQGIALILIASATNDSIVPTYPIPCVPSIKLAKKTEMKLEASRFGNHAIQHIQIPEAE